MTPVDLHALLARLESATEPNMYLDIELWVRLGSAERRDFEWSDRLPTDPDARCNGLEMGEAIAAGWPAADIRTIWKVPALTASLDAAVSLVERVLPHWDWSIERDGAKMGDVTYFASVHEVRPDFLARCRMETADTPSLALCAALVRAIIAQREPVTAPNRQVQA